MAQTREEFEQRMKDLHTQEKLHMKAGEDPRSVIPFQRGDPRFEFFDMLTQMIIADFIENTELFAKMSLVYPSNVVSDVITMSTSFKIVKMLERDDTPIQQIIFTPDYIQECKDSLDQ